MNLLLLSINPSAMPVFLEECLGALGRPARLGYVGDAAEGMPFAEVERSGIEALGYELVPLRARGTEAEAFAEMLDTLDAVYVAGGETFVLLEALRSNGAGEVLAERVRSGLPYIGSSAGSIITGPSITPVEMLDDRSLAPDLTSDEGLGLIDHVIIPHADGKIPPYPVELIERIISTYGDRYQLLTLNDDQALRVRPDRAEVIRSA